MPVFLLGFLISGCCETARSNRLGYLYSDGSWGEPPLVGRTGLQRAGGFAFDFKKSLLFSLPSKFLSKLKTFSGPVVLSRTIHEVMKMPQVWFD